jgi:uncharacterized protein (TIGR03118 family)
MNYLTALTIAGTMSAGFFASPLAPNVAPDNDTRYRVVNLVSDIPGMAPILDPNLVNPWGIARNPGGGPFWVSNAGTGTSTLYSGDVNGSPFVKAALVVTIPGGLPTGQVFNPTTDFQVTAGGVTARAFFIFCSISGFITGWNPGVPPPPPSTTATVGASSPGSVYTGLAIGNNGSANFLYAANVSMGRIDVYDSAFSPTTLSGSFTDPLLPAGFSPFNIQALDGALYVAYLGPGDEPDEMSGAVSKFDFNGNFLSRVATGGPLNEPWGLTIAPADFGTFGNALLVGNFGNGRIHGYDLSTGRLLGALKSKRGGPIRLSGLWAILFGNGISAGDTNALYFAAGIENEEHGLLGKIVVDP